MADVEVTQADREANAAQWEAAGFTERAKQTREGKWDDDDEVQLLARHRTEALAAAQAEIAELRAMIVDNPNWICEGIPDAVIEAGIAAFDQTQTDLQNYVSGQTPDWDEGMICAAIFKAMLRRALGAKP